MKKQGPYQRLNAYRRVQQQAYRPDFHEYERLKAKWLDDHMAEPYTCQQYEQAMREIAERCGI